MNKKITAQFKTELERLGTIPQESAAATLTAIIEAEQRIINLVGHERHVPAAPERKTKPSKEQIEREKELVHYLPAANRIFHQSHGEELLGRTLKLYVNIAEDAVKQKKENKTSGADSTVNGALHRTAIALDGITTDDLTHIFLASKQYEKLKQKGARASLSLFTERYAHVITNRFYSYRPIEEDKKTEQNTKPAENKDAQTPPAQDAPPEQTTPQTQPETQTSPEPSQTTNPEQTEPTPEKPKEDAKKKKKPRRKKAERNPDQKSTLALKTTATLLKRETTAPVDEFLAQWADWGIRTFGGPLVGLTLEELASINTIIERSGAVPDADLTGFIEDTRNTRGREKYNNPEHNALLTARRTKALARIAQEPAKYIGTHRYIYAVMPNDDVDKALDFVAQLNLQEKKTLGSASALVSGSDDYENLRALTTVIEQTLQSPPKRNATFALIQTASKQDSRANSNKETKARLVALLPEIKNALALSEDDFATVASRAITKFSTYAENSSEYLASLHAAARRAADPKTAKTYVDLAAQITEDRALSGNSLGTILESREATQRTIDALQNLDEKALDAINKTARAFSNENTTEKRVKNAAEPLYIDEIVIKTAKAARIDPKKAHMYATDLLSTHRRRIPYNLRPVFDNLPALTEKLEPKHWNRLKRVILTADAGYKATKEKGAPTKILLPFVKPIIDAVAQTEPQKIPYLIRELSDMQRRIMERHHSGPIPLEELVCKNVTTLRKKLGRKNLTRLHEIFGYLYQSPSQGASLSAGETLARIARDLRATPKEYRDAVIDGLHRILSEESAKDTPLSLRNTLAAAYTRTLRERASGLGDNIPSWIARARSFETIDQIIHFLQDPKGYYEAETETFNSGLLLSDVQLTLLTYAQSLTGTQFTLRKRTGNALTATIEKDTIVLPESISASKNAAENFSVYKSLVSWQAGSVEFGTYALLPAIAKQKGLDQDATIEDLLDSYENPALARELFHILEFARVDSHLHEQYPGLVKDLALAKKALARKVRPAGKGDAEGILAHLNRYALGVPSQESVSDLCAHVDSVRGKTLEATAHALDALYQKLSETIAPDKRIAPREHALEINLSQAKHIQKTYGARIAAPDATPAFGRRYRYDEWDHTTGQYKPKFTQVIETLIPSQRNGYVERVLVRDARAIAQLKEWFETLPPEQRERVKKQTSGDIDMDEYIQTQAEIKKGITPSDKIYTRERKNNRSVASLLLFELSGSLRKFIDIKRPDRRLMDAVRDSAIYFSEAMDAAGDPYAIAGFSGETEQNVEYYPVKAFTQNYDDNVATAIGSLVPLKQSRDGAGIRHATAQLLQTDARTKFLIYLMEGMPNDHGYTDQYALEDTKRAVVEARSLGVTPIVFAFGSPVNPGLQALAEHAIYREVKDPSTLAATLPHIYAKYAF